MTAILGVVSGTSGLKIIPLLFNSVVNFRESRQLDFCLLGYLKETVLKIVDPPMQILGGAKGVATEWS